METHLAAGSFLRQLLANEQEGQSVGFGHNKLANISAASRVHMEENPGMGKLAVHLLLQVMNETFLILPIVRCMTAKQVHLNQLSNELQQAHSMSASLHEVPTNEQQYDACFIDWPRVKIVEDRAMHEPTKHRSELVLSSLLHYRENELRPYQVNHNDPTEDATYSKLQSHFAESSNSTSTTIFRNSSDIIDYNLFKYSYLSVSSLLSLCGILINLFIILIVVFRYRQNCSSIFQSNNTGQNNLLISQLTITGLLLASYFLYDSISIKNAPTVEARLSDKIRESIHSDDSTSPHCLYNDMNLPSPLSTFLPPVQFKFNKLACYSSGSDPHNDLSARMDSSSDNSIEEVETFSPFSSAIKQPQVVLLLSQNIVSSENKLRGDMARWYLEYYNSTMNSRRTIDLSETLQSIDMAKVYCDDGKTQDRPRRAQRSPIENEDDTEDDYQILQPTVRYSFLELFVLTSIPLIINVIASIHIWTVAALSYDRYSAIAQPLQYLRSIHASKVRTFLLITWTTAILFSLLVPVVLHFNNLVSNLTSSVHQTNGSHMSRATKTSNEAFEIESDSADKQDSSCSLFKILNGEPTFMLNMNHLHHLLQDFTTRPSLDLYTGEGWQSKPKMDQLNRQPNFVEQIVSIFIELSSKPETIAQSFEIFDDSDRGLRLYKFVVLFHSLFTFVAFILVPLLVITVCNISIYRIVKVHERRLSINSGSNIPATTSNFRRPSYRRDCGSSLNYDNHSEIGSMSSLLLAKLTRVGLIKPSIRHDDPANVCSDSLHTDSKEFFNNEKLSDDRYTVEVLDKGEGVSPTITNRSKRVLARQDSFHLMAKLHGGSNNEDNSTESELKSNEMLLHQTKVSCPCSGNSVSFGTPRPRRTRLKRKISDQRTGLLVRKDSSISQPDEYCHRSRKDPDSYSCAESPSIYNLDQSKYGSGGFMNQLKMAGLSFAGIAIQELSIGVYQKKLNKSTSYSLGNLNSSQQLINHNETNDVGQSVSRCSVETSSYISSAKRSYVSMNTTSPRKHKASPSKCSTRLVDDESDDVNQSESHGTFHHHSSHRLPSTLGTKSAAFNVVTWLMITMLIFALPHYLLITVNQIIYLSYGDRFNQLLKRAEAGSHDDKLIASSRMIIAAMPTERGAGYFLDVTEAKLGQIGSFLLSCLCRILFLGMVPLNSWLYGIRSRSLKTTIRMVLKRYISRRQASIEINHRQRSISSIRSRDSSLANLSANHQNANHCNNCNHHRTIEGSERTYKRCSSFSGGQRRALARLSMNSSLLNGTRAIDTTSVESINKEARDPKLSVNNAIRFLIDDYSVNKVSTDTNLPPSSQEESLASSLASSSRSLMSSSVQSMSYNPVVDHCSKSACGESGLMEHHLAINDTNSKPNKASPTEGSAIVASASTVEVNADDPVIKTDSIQAPLSAKKSIVSVDHHLVDPEETSMGKLTSYWRRESSPDCQNFTVASTHNTCLQPIKKSTSEFKFMVTSADHEHYVIEFNKNTSDETLPLSGAVRRDLNSNGHGDSVGMGDQLDGWYQYVKRTLVKLLPNSSFNSLIRTQSDIRTREQRRESCDCRSQFDSNLRDQCRVSLLRKNSVESIQHGPKPNRSRLSCNSPSRKKMRNSMTMSDISSMEQVNIPINCQCPIHQVVGSGADRLSVRSVADQSHSYLKPPNFLKLVFEPNLGAYSNTSALSPIKECSSNHSYASSQSSLNNSNQLLQQQRDRIPSIGECTGPIEA